VSLPLARPAGAKLVNDHLLAINWSDGTVLHYAMHELRAACPCAMCTNRPPDAPPLSPGDFPGIKLQSLKQVGNYAFQIGFDDGHALGIYSFDKLRRIGHPEGQAPSVPPKPSTEFNV
jgi:ATP-binding protein involved in chromosome partitioning